MAAKESQLAVGDGDLKDPTRFNKRFRKFVEAFVDHFEGKLKQYCETSEGKLQKISKRGTVLEYLVTGVLAGFGVFLGNAEVGAKIGQLGGGLLGKYFGRKHHENRAHLIHANIGLAAAETVKLRATLVETATEIFRVFEMQFMMIESEKGWHKAMQDLAHEAVERIINFTHKHLIHNITSDLLTKGFLGGKPKFKRSLDPTPHRVTFQEVSFKISALYEKACLRVSGNPDTFYMREGKDIDVAMKYGCRLIFKCEDRALTGFKNFEPKPPVDYCYHLQGEEVTDKHMIEVMAAINEKDPNFKLDAIYTGLDNWMSKILNSLGTILEELKRARDATEVDSGLKKGGLVFNLHKPVECFKGRDVLLQEGPDGIYDALQNKKQVVTVTGPGGIGKTELARKFAADFKGNYDGNIIWINCSLLSNMVISFRKLAKSLQKNDDAAMNKGQEWDSVPYFVRDVHAFFQDKKCLFIFDDVQQFKDIETFLPQRSGTNSHVLITSRIDLDRDFPMLPLTSFKPDEATKFLQAKLTAHESLQEEIMAIIETVDCSPLILQLIVACVEEQRSRGVAKPVVDILSYLERYSNEVSDASSEVLYGVISFLMKLIEIEPLGSHALKTLQVLAFFFSENIPCMVFSKLFIDSENSISREKCKQVRDLLAKYSVIALPSEGCGVFTLHQIIQANVKLSFSEEEERQVLRAALRSLRAGTPEEHVLAVWESATRHVGLVNEFKHCTYGGEANSILHLFAMNGHRHAMINLLKAFQDEDSKNKFLNVCNKSGNTAMHLAAKNGFFHVIQYLKNQNASDKIKNKMDRTPFHESIVKGQLHIVKYFAEQLALSAESEENINLVCLAATSGNLKVVQYLITKQNMPFLKRGKARRLPVHEACRGNKQDVVEYLLDWPGADVEVTDIEGNRPLHYAAQYGYLQLVKYLIEEKGVMFSPKNNFGKTPAHCAVKSGYIEIVDYFLNNEPTVELMSPKNKFTLWHEAAYWGRLKILKYFSEYVPSISLPNYRLPINSTDSYGNTPLHEACSGGDLNVVKYLVEVHQARVDAVNQHNKLPIHKAAVSGKLNIVRYFVEDQKIAVDVQVKNGSTPLHEATYGGHLPVVKFLVDSGADIERLNEFRRTPLFGAVKNKQSKHLNVLKYLVEEKCCKIHIRDYKGKTPLQVAQEKGNDDAVQYLEARLRQASQTV